MTRESILAYRHLALEECAFQVALKTPAISIQLGKVEEPKVEFVAAENTYSPWELSYYFGIETEKAKTGIVAIIPVKGTLAPEWTWAGTNTEWLSQQINVAIGNPSVCAIVLKGMSGGGTVAGTIAAAQTVKAANAIKPVLGWVSGMVASAAYWIFSQTQEIYLESAVSSAVGSLGVMAVYVSQYEQLKNEGLDVRVLRSEGAEDKYLLHPAEPINESALEEEQKVLNSMRGEFLKAVKDGRPQLTTDPGGKLYYGREAVRMGLADEVASMNDVIKRADYLARKRSLTNAD